MAENGATPGVAPGDRCAIGISFGNSYSSIACTIDDSPVVIANEDGGKLLAFRFFFSFSACLLCSSCRSRDPFWLDQLTILFPRPSDPYSSLLRRRRRVHRKPRQGPPRSKPQEHRRCLQGLPGPRVRKPRHLL